MWQVKAKSKKQHIEWGREESGPLSQPCVARGNAIVCVCVDSGEDICSAGKRFVDGCPEYPSPTPLVGFHLSVSPSHPTPHPPSAIVTSAFGKVSFFLGEFTTTHEDEEARCWCAAVCTFTTWMHHLTRQLPNKQPSKRALQQRTSQKTQLSITPCKCHLVFKQPMHGSHRIWSSGVTPRQSQSSHALKHFLFCGPFTK